MAGGVVKPGQLRELLQSKPVITTVSYQIKQLHCPI